MKVLLINTSDIIGGAARAAYRLHQSLLSAGVESRMLVQSKASDDHTVIGPNTKTKKALAKVMSAIDSIPLRKYKNRTETLFSPAWVSSFGIVDQINLLKPDIVHLHWVNGGMLRPEVLSKIKAPIVWSLHDDWAFTGGCHIKWECKKYKDACGSCPRLGSKKENDLSRKVHQRKQKAISSIKNLTIIGLSKWLTNCAVESSLFRNRSVYNIPNSIDTKKYSPIEKYIARDLLNLPQNKKLVIFSAMSATTNINKGFSELSAALNKIDALNTELMVFGSGRPKDSQGFNQKAHYYGRLHDDISLRVLYSAADVMVVPSLQENLSNAIMESMACGTPVVAFNVGGNSDLIKHKKNGYLSEPYKSKDLVKGIAWVLNNENNHLVGKNARKEILINYSNKNVAIKYIQLYDTILKGHKI